VSQESNISQDEAQTSLFIRPSPYRAVTPFISVVKKKQSVCHKKANVSVCSEINTKHTIQSVGRMYNF
jgi:hypothetical protein